MLVQKLRDSLRDLPDGPIPDNRLKLVLNALANAWNSLGGSDYSSMTAKKVDRAESLHFESPILLFRIERHGAWFNGSTRAEMQTWYIDIEKETATVGQNGSRQLRPTDKKLNIAPLATKIFRAIKSAKPHRNLKWLAKDSGVRVVNIEDLIPTTFKQTTASRRKRFRKELERQLLTIGWGPKDGASSYTYMKIPG